MEFTADDASTPSINAALMPRFVGRRVRLVCELEGPGDGKTLAARASDKGAVSIVKDARAGLPTTKYAEFVGVVEAPGKLREESNTNWGDSFDLNMHNEAVMLMVGKYERLFYQAL